VFRSPGIGPIAVAIALLSAAIGSISHGAEIVTTSTSTSTSASTMTVTSGGGFDPSPRMMRGRLLSVDPARHSLLFTQSNGQKIEITIPARVTVYSAKRQHLNLEELQPGSTFQVRYRPLTMDAIEIHQANEN
jgi:hypothetical protein